MSIRLLRAVIGVLISLGFTYWTVHGRTLDLVGLLATSREIGIAIVTFGREFLLLIGIVTFGCAVLVIYRVLYCYGAGRGMKRYTRKDVATGGQSAFINQEWNAKQAFYKTPADQVYKS